MALLAAVAQEWGGPHECGGDQEEEDDTLLDMEDDLDDETVGRDQSAVGRGQNAAPKSSAEAEELTRRLAAALMPDRGTETRCGLKPGVGVHYFSGNCVQDLPSWDVLPHCPPDSLFSLVPLSLPTGAVAVMQGT